MFIRSITINISPRGGLVRAGSKCTIAIWLDEKPLGRRMRPHWQEARQITVKADITDLAGISQTLVNAAHAAQISEDVSLHIRSRPRFNRGPRYSEQRIGRVRDQLSQTIDSMLLSQRLAA